MLKYHWVLLKHGLFFSLSHLHLSTTAVRGHSSTTLTRFWTFRQPTYLPRLEIREEISLLLNGKICIPLILPVPPRLVNVVCERPLKRALSGLNKGRRPDLITPLAGD
jgi:hypothetical protein